MKGFNKHFATVFTENEAHKVMLPSGEVIPHLVQTIANDGIEMATVTMTLACNVVATKKDAIDRYNEPCSAPQRKWWYREYRFKGFFISVGKSYSKK